MSCRLVSQVIQNKKSISVPARTTVRQAAHMMKVHRTSALLVVGPTQKLIGICTERDLVFDVLADSLDPDETSVSAIMTANPQTIGPDKPLGHALHMMYEGGFRHVPVVDEAGQPLGLISARDALDSEVLDFDEDLIKRQEITVAL